MQLEARGFVLRRNWWLPLLFAVGGVTGVAVGLQGASPIGWMVAVAGFMFVPVFVARDAFPMSMPVTLRASAQGVTFAGTAVDERSLPADQIQEVKLVPRGREARVTLLDRAGKTFVFKLTIRDAQALIALLGARRATFRLMVPLWKRFYGLLLSFAAIAFVLLGATEDFIFSLSIVGTLALLGSALLGLLLRGRLIVGSDGFTTKWLGIERFVPYRDVTSVVQRASWQGTQIDAAVVLRSGKRRLFRVIESPDTEADRHTEVVGLVAHLADAAQRAMQLGQARVDVPALVGRGGRSDRDWLAAIDTMVRGRGQQYRVAALSPELLADVTTDPTADADARLGAATALVRIGAAPERARVRVVAEACADPELRGALLAISEAHDDESAEAALRVLRR